MKRPLSPLSLLDPGAVPEEDDGEHEVAVTLRLTRDAVTVRAPIPTGPSRPRRFLPLFRALTDAIVERGQQASARRGAPISCRAGCAMCCRHLVPVSETEAHSLRDLVEDLPPPRRRLVERRFAAVRARLAESGLLERILVPGPLGNDELIELGLEYFVLAIACPFLEDERCTIYAERPLVCREYLVTSPEEHCQDPTSSEVARLLIEGDVSQALDRFESDPTSRGVHWVPLPLAPEWANAHPDLAPPEASAALLSRALRLVQEHAADPEEPAKKSRKKRGGS